MPKNKQIPKQSASKPMTNTVGTKWRFFLIVGVLIVTLLGVFLVRYFVVLPRQEKARFAKTEQIADEAVSSLPQELRQGVDKKAVCQHSMNKYGEGAPFCTITLNLSPTGSRTQDGTESRKNVSQAVTSVFAAHSARVRPAEDHVTYGLDGLACILAYPHTTFATGDSYVISCSGQVTRYVY